MKMDSKWYQDKKYPGMWAGWFVLVFWLTILALFIPALVFTIQGVSNHAERTNCNKFGNTSGYETEFAYFGFWHNECYVILPNGNKIPQEQLINNQGN